MLHCKNLHRENDFLETRSQLASALDQKLVYKYRFRTDKTVPTSPLGPDS